MKKTLSLFLALVLCFSLAACKNGEDKKNESQHSIDVEYYAKLGEMPEHKYALGADSDEMKNTFDAEDAKNNENNSAEHSHSVYSLVEADDYSFISYESANYYYENNSDGKIKCIVSLDTSYGFPIGTLSLEVKNALSEFKCEEKNGDSDFLFFLPSSAVSSYTYLKYEFGKNNVIFAFQDNALCAVMLYCPENS